MSENEKIVVNKVVLREGKKVLSCAQASKLSQEQDISLKEIGEVCNQHGIKINWLSTRLF